MRFTNQELELFDAVFKSCMSVALAYDKYHSYSFDQIRHGMPSKEFPKGHSLPKAHRDLILKVKGLDNFASLFSPINYKNTMDRLIKYLVENRIQPIEFELQGVVWIDKNPFKIQHIEVVFEVQK